MISEQVGGFINTARAEDRLNGPVHEAIDSVEKRVAEMRETISRLARRLEPVSNPTVGTGEKRGPTPEPVLSPVAGRLNSIYNVLVETHDRLNELLDQLEI